MANQNLNLELDLTMLNSAIQGKVVDVNKWVDKNGTEHASVMLFVRETREPNDKKTHNVTLKARSDSEKPWADAKDANDKVIYCGKATPSKYQPTNNTPQQSQNVGGVEVGIVY